MSSTTYRKRIFFILLLVSSPTFDLLFFIHPLMTVHKCFLRQFFVYLSLHLYIGILSLVHHFYLHSRTFSYLRVWTLFFRSSRRLSLLVSINEFSLSACLIAFPNMCPPVIPLSSSLASLIDFPSSKTNIVLPLFNPACDLIVSKQFCCSSLI